MRYIYLLLSLFMFFGVFITFSNMTKAEAHFNTFSKTFADGSTFNIDVYSLEKEEINIENYVLTGFVRSKMPIVTRYNPEGKSLTIVNDEAVVSNAVTTSWNGITPNLSLQYGGLSSISDNANLCRGAASNGENTINWYPISGTVLATACWWTGADECDIEISSNANWGSGGIDLKTVLWHEIGHCAGLGHSLDTNAVMFASYHGIMTAPHSDDIAGVCAVYVCSGTPANTPPGTVGTSTIALSTPTPTRTPTFSFTPTRTPETLIPVGSLTPISTPTQLPLCGIRPAVKCIKIPLISKD